MNTLNRRAYALLLTVIVSNAAYGMETEMVNTVSAEQQEVVVATAWNRKKIVAAVITGAAIVYTVAAYMNKVSSPVELWKNVLKPILPFNNNANVTNDNNSTDINKDVKDVNVSNVVVSENVSMTQMEKIYQPFATIFRGLNKGMNAREFNEAEFNKVWNRIEH